MKFAQVIPATYLPPAKSQIFSYSLPEELVSNLKVGTIVEIPFGPKTILGVVKKIEGEETGKFALKPINKIVTDELLFTSEQFAIAEFIADSYAESLSAVVKTMLAKYAPRAALRELSSPAAYPSFKLTTDQQKALKRIIQDFDKSQTFLLYGVTGSGKTEVYLRAAQEIIQSGKQVLILVPEIALTPQNFSRFSARFKPGEVSVIHSKISYGQKYRIWKRVYDNECKVLIGPRSAMFAPFKKLGMIVIDEEHDASFKQSEQHPKYNAIRLSQKLSEIWTCPLILGDATPSVETYHRSEQNQITRLDLTTRMFQGHPSVDIVSMKEEMKNANFSIFSEALLSAIGETLKNSRKTILYLNRRGSATSLQCRDCGEVVKCKRCDVPTVYHFTRKSMTCHHCDRVYPMAVKCAKCGGVRLKYTGTGTEKIENEIQALYPNANILRLDRDTVPSKKESVVLYQKLMSGDFDILVGTQLVAKGWDFPDVDLIGIINADTGLSLPDFKSNERVFQLITQVIGRSGRGANPGRVILQTYDPENRIISYAKNHDNEEFYKQEIMDRKEFNYPPFCRLIKLTFRHPNQNAALDEGAELVSRIQLVGAAEVIGPSPSFIPRVRGRFGVYVIIKLPDPSQPIPSKIKSLLQEIGGKWDVDIDPDNLL